MIQSFEKVLVDIEEDIHCEDGIRVYVTFPQKKECRNVWSNPHISLLSFILDLLLLINAGVGIWGHRKVVHTSAIAIAAAVQAGEMILTVHHMCKH
jgi:hypothetical protein